MCNSAKGGGKSGANCISGIMPCGVHAVLHASIVQERNFNAPKNVLELDGETLQKVEACNECLPYRAHTLGKLGHACVHPKAQACDCEAQIKAQLRKSFAKRSADEAPTAS